MGGWPYISAYLVKGSDGGHVGNAAIDGKAAIFVLSLESEENRREQIRCEENNCALLRSTFLKDNKALVADGYFFVASPDRDQSNSDKTVLTSSGLFMKERKSCNQLRY